MHFLAIFVLVHHAGIEAMTAAGVGLFNRPDLSHHPSTNI
jgi:hypothetical protein